MSARALARLAPVVLVLAAGLSACGGDEEPAPADTSQTTSTDETAAPEDDATSTPTDDATTAPEDDTVAVTVTREGGDFTPNGERVELGVGQTLVLTIDADEAGELHVHSTPEQDIAYGAGTSEHEITVDRPGVVEVESHDPDLVLLQLEVR
ncbi:hypothetical protein GCM10011376_24560 [Nocardioides flavus (ex Wang et al. 2016)]|uniref:EfeO-type cupredoxin-like domain-containing protein n=1 Tax=Nocardioides flavus (ex Wang et al. 2016) TaxID=2058780 RepID=A0ABQ3HJV9_9ACTN|nr:hypothetical protein [Nocardioides flavus (ex Wang et al. 2016)]GHE17846.1 hypothetical protein GCM10011376_24560 [Nocardioides flavus (ex Wang et al. 2016)]